MKHNSLLVAIPLFLALAGSAFAILPGRASEPGKTTLPRTLRDTTPAPLPMVNLADTGRVPARQPSRISKILPRRATVRSLMLPGLGQLYNRQYWKVPIVYAGLGMAISVYRWNSGLYDQYLTGYQNAYNSTVIDPLFGTKTAIVQGKILPIQQLKRKSDQFRRQRDLTIILTVLGWVLNAVEANVAAHLKTFDVSDDLSLRITPCTLPGSGPGLVPGVRVALTY